MSARDVMTRACFDPGKFVGARRDGEGSDQWRARAALEALTAAGYRILGPDELLAMQALVDWAHHEVGADIDLTPGLATAIRALTTGGER